MMGERTPSLRCGEALCKKPVSLPDRAARPWPVPCESCGCNLYPRDILQSTLPTSELELQRAELMQVGKGRLEPCSSDDLRRWALEESGLAATFPNRGPSSEGRHKSRLQRKKSRH